MKWRRAQPGFTLVELMVTIGVMTLVLTAAALNGRTSNAARLLNSAGEEIRLALYQTRSLALGPSIDRTIGSQGYCFVFTSPTGSGPYNGYQIREIDNLQTACSLQKQVVTERELPRQIEATLTSGNMAEVAYVIDGYGTLVRPTGGDKQIVELRHTRNVDPVVLEFSPLTGQVELCQGATCR